MTELLVIFYNLEQSCGGVLTNVSGVITSPNYPNNYPNGITCTWKISTETTHVNLTIEDFMVSRTNDTNLLDKQEGIRKVPSRPSLVNTASPYFYIGAQEGAKKCTIIRHVLQLKIAEVGTTREEWEPRHFPPGLPLPPASGDAKDRTVL